MSEIVELASGLRFPEGPIAMKDGSVLVVEIERGTLTRVTTDGSSEVVAHCGGGPNGAALGPDGRVYICNNGGMEWVETDDLLIPTGVAPKDYVGGMIQAVDLETGTVETLYTECNGNRLVGANDIVFDHLGGFYFTDIGKIRSREADLGALFYALADGSEIREVVFPLQYPNGVGLSPDGSRLYVSETWTGRVWAWQIEEPGTIKPGTTPFAPGDLLYSMPGWQPLDSLAVDSEGNVCVATLMTGAITSISPEGSVNETLLVPEHDPMVTNICFGGGDMRTAYITSSCLGKLYVTEWDTPGLVLNYADRA
jgi:gluconolactonase